MDITREHVLQLAKLARLELTDKEVDQLCAQLPGIVDYVAQLQRVDTTSVAELVRPTTSLRTDDVQASAAVDAILSQAPERSEQYWKVDAVFS